MTREALAWLTSNSRALEVLSQCFEKSAKAKKEGDKKPERVLSDCLQEAKIVPRWASELEAAMLWYLAYLAGPALHFDAFGLSKDMAVNAYRKSLSGDKLRAELTELAELMDEFTPYPSVAAEHLVHMPPGSFLVDFKFQLSKPYISKDDTEFYVIDNPVKKDWVFKIPVVTPGQWKGCLHAAMVRQLADWWAGLSDEERTGNEDEFIRRRLQLVYLFGNEQGVDVDVTKVQSYLDRLGGRDLAEAYRGMLKAMTRDGRRRGRLMFYPTFFGQMGIEVINPHDRKTGAGSRPVFFEAVPPGTCGRFSLLYLPFDRAGEDVNATLREATDDLCRVAEGIDFLLIEFGFGAKTANGFGRAVLASSGKVVFRTAAVTEESITLDHEIRGSLVRSAEEIAAQVKAMGVAGSGS